MLKLMCWLRCFYVIFSSILWAHSSYFYALDFVQVAALHVLECNQKIDTVSGIHSNVVLFCYHIVLVGSSRFLC